MSQVVPFDVFLLYKFVTYTHLPPGALSKARRVLKNVKVK